MIYQKKTINNVPTKIPLSNSAPVGNPIGTIISTYKKIQPRNYLYCDGSTFDENVYPALYLYLGTNVLPDYRECAMVGAEKNTTDVFDSTEIDPSTGLAGTQNHDVYTQGQFKDDQLQDHRHISNVSGSGNTGITRGTVGADSAYTGPMYNGRFGQVTRGKRKAVYYYIKAIDGVDISDEDTFLNTVKNYIDERNSYSTDETLTGWTWIDGKPIYRIMLTTTVRITTDNTSFGGLQTTIGNLDLDTVVYASGIDNANRISFRPLFFSSVSGFLPLGSGLEPNSTVILEYTKTTD